MELSSGRVAIRGYLCRPPGDTVAIRGLGVDTKPSYIELGACANFHVSYLAPLSLEWRSLAQWLFTWRPDCSLSSPYPPVFIDPVEQ